MIAHDDDDLPKNGPIRIKARDRPPTQKPKLKEEGKREDSKLAKVRRESTKVRSKMQSYLELTNSFLAKIVLTLDSTTSFGKVILQADWTRGYRQNLALIPLVTPQNLAPCRS
jgi:hypothetical protein